MDPRNVRAAGLVLVLALAELPLPLPVAGQTALLVEVELGGEEWYRRVASLESGIVWAFGPVRVTREHGTAVPSGREADEVVVVVPLRRSAEREAAPHASGPGREPGLLIRTEPVTWDGVEDPARTARTVERRAREALASAVEAGRLPHPPVPRPVHTLGALNVTAMRHVLDVRSTPFAVSVLGGDERAPVLMTGPADLFREVPGLDVEGVGGQQRRPVIRGLRGQRILLLADGLRLNNPRRRVDSGEPLNMVGPGELERIEVVRGPASVLYGSDAIGGVVNLVTRDLPTTGEGPGLGGSLRLGWSSAGDGISGHGQVTGAAGPVSFRLAAGRRRAGSYRAPAGTFGEVSFDESVEVRDTRARDLGGSLEAEWRVAAGDRLFVRYQRSVAEDAGFGYVDPERFGEGLPTVRLLFPRQAFARQVVGYRGSDLGRTLADRLEVTAFRQTNDRLFVTDVHVPFGEPLPPGSFTALETRSRTELTSDGFRAEARKLLGRGLLLTYGLDLHRDGSQNADSSTSTTVVGGGDPRVSGGSVSRVPEARLRSLGVFAQVRAEWGERAQLTLGARYQDVHARALDGDEPLEGSRVSDRTVVGAANALLKAGDGVALVASVGRGFRSPNLVERFYSGPTPEGRGLWVRNPDLGAETSLSVDLGVRVTRRRLEAEAFVFRNLIRDGIRLEDTGEEVDGSAVYRNVNVAELRLRGLEARLGVELGGGVSVRGGATWIDESDGPGLEGIVAEGYGTKLTGALRYDRPRARFWTEYAVRWQGRRDDVVLDRSYVGPHIPGFTVHDLRGGTPFLRGTLTVELANLTDALYAEALNVGFFRPEPGRHLRVGWSVSF